MTTVVWPPLPADELKKAEEETLARELQWLLNSLQDTFASLKSGLEECNDLLAPIEPGSTLVVSSPRSESVKGFVTRVGMRIVKADIQLRFQTLPPPTRSGSYPLRLSTTPSAPALIVPQLSTARNLINQALDVVDISTWTGDAHDANFISGQLRLLRELVQEARQTLKGGEEIVGQWWEDAMDENTFSPALPPTLALTITIADASIHLNFRTLLLSSPDSSAPNQPASSFFLPTETLSLRQRLGLASRLPEHDEMDKVFTWKGKEVKVREKVRVESQDPSLMAVMAKLSGLEHAVRGAGVMLATVMGKDDGNDG